MFRHLMTRILFGFGSAVAVTVTAVADNNLVTTLPVTVTAGQTAFTLPHDGWIHLQSPVATGKWQLSGTAGLTVERNGGEAFAYLRAGQYTLNDPAVTVRQVPATVFCSMAGRYGVDDPVTIPSTTNVSGRTGMFLYNWNYLEKNILPAFNTLVLGSAHHPDVERWCLSGRKLIRQKTLSNDPKTHRSDWETVTAPEYISGVLPDEFILPSGRADASDVNLGYTKPGRGFEATTQEAIKAWSAAHPDKRFYAWLGVPWNAENSAIRPLFETVKAVGGMIAWESYAYSRNYENELTTRYLNRAAGFAKLAPDAMRCFMICPATMEFSDNNAYVDFKVWLDQQLHTVATHPDFAGTGGLGMWIAYYTDPEILRWYARLVRHYGIEGRKTMLSEKYGYRIEPNLLKSAEWESLKSWNPRGAVTLVDRTATGIPMRYYPRTAGNLLKMTRTADGKLNSVSQTLPKLEPGKLYSLVTLITSADTIESQALAADIRLENAEILSSRLRLMRDYIPGKHTWNSYKIVFRAGTTPVRLTIAESADAARLQPPTLLVDSVAITPYFDGI